MTLEERYAALKAKVVERKADFDAFVNMLEVETSWQQMSIYLVLSLRKQRGINAYKAGS